MEENQSEQIHEEKPPKKEHSNQGKRWIQLTIAVAIVAGIGFMGGWLGSELNKNFRETSLNTAQAREVVSEQSELISGIASDVGPSVVSINVSSKAVTSDFFFGDREVEQQSAGTGFIISDDGYIVTNRHVIEGADDVSVTLSDGTELTEVEVIGTTSSGDPLDIGFLKITDKKDKELVPAKLGDSAEMKVGDMVVAVGNALGQFQNTVTSGIISGYGRNLDYVEGGETLQNLFQTDAAINSGNSGGPLVNASGEVIGINTAVAGGAENIGFSIPINDAKGLITSVLDQGKLVKPYLGVRYVMLTDDIAYQYNLVVSRGAYILPSGLGGGSDSIVQGSPAEKSGLKEKDVITKIDNVELDENHSLVSVLGSLQVGKVYKFEVSRGNEVLVLDVTLEAAPTD